MRVFIRLSFVVAAGLSLANCATVTRGLTNQIQITSEPSGAKVRTSLAHACTTPCTLQVDRKAEFDVIYELPGYREVTIPVRTQVAGAGAVGLAGNVLVGGIVGMGVDVATGATLEHSPNPVHAVMEPVGRALPPGRRKPGKPVAVAPARVAPPPAAPVEEEAPT